MKVDAQCVEPDHDYYGSGSPVVNATHQPAEGNRVGYVFYTVIGVIRGRDVIDNQKKPGEE